MSVHTLVIAFLVFMTGSAFAQGTTDKKPVGPRKQNTERARSAQQKKKTLTSKSADISRRTGLNKSQQATAIAFAKANHPELVPLLNSLKRRREPDYNREVRQLHQASTRLGKLKERVQNERYEQELAVWKLDSRIRLQLAKWSVSKDDKLGSEIRKALAERQAIRKAQYERELARLDERRTKVESMLRGLTDEKLDKEWEQLSKSITRRRRQSAAKKRSNAQTVKSANDKSKKKDDK